MDLKNKVKDFFTLGRRGNGGFTLVELIVVIAILAILGGVAVPAYSGYVKKAELAADEALLYEVNNAFVSACLASGESNVGRATKPTVSKNAELTDSGNVVEYYKQFFDGNEGTVFNTVAPRYNSDLGMFELKPVLGKGGNWSGLEVLAGIFPNSNYYMNGEGIAELSGTIDTLANFLAIANGGGLIEGLKEMDGFDAVLAALNIDPNTADDQTLANAAVFYVANKLQGATATELQEAMANDAYGEGVGLAGYLQTQCGVDPNSNEGKFVATAVQYALLQSYVNYAADNAGEETKFTIVENGTTKNLSGTELKEYFAANPPHNSGEASNLIKNLIDGNETFYMGYIENDAGNDVDVFLGIMGVVDENTGAFDDISGEGVFSNSDIQDVLNQYLGGN